MKCYAVDIDGVLCEISTLPFTERPPIKKNIAATNKLYDEGHIVILHTARLNEDKVETEYWTRLHGIKYHAIVYNKLKADYYIDDRNLQIDEL